MSEPGHRASDAEREAVAERLRDAAAEGRLTTDELGERVEAAYKAQTTAELEPLTADLPPTPLPKAAALSVWRNEQVRHRLAALLTANPICIAVWLASGATGSFWPKWVLLGTAAAFIVTLVHAALGTEERERSLPEPPPRPPGLPR
ncbi:MAG: DUF1707 SHOCT-like domain-containing protein [Thermoleophilaceae bacterium]